MSSLGDLVKAAREERGMSVAELAQASGLSETYVRNIEKGTAGNKRPSLSTMQALAIGLRKHRSYFEDDRGHQVNESPGDYVPADPFSFVSEKERARLINFAERMMSLPESDRVEVWLFIDEFLRMKMFQLGDREAHPPRIVGEK